MTVHAYVNNGMPQLRLDFPNGFTASIVVKGDGSASLCHWPTHWSDDSEPRRFTDAEIQLCLDALTLGPMEADAQDIATWLAGVATLPDRGVHEIQPSLSYGMAETLGIPIHEINPDNISTEEESRDVQ